MKKRFLVLSFLLFIICSFNLSAENFQQKANKIEDFIPKGWKKLIVKKGDLNKDKIDDVVLVIEKNDPKDIRESGLKYIIPAIKNFNPRIILVLLKDKNSQYNLVAKNEEEFIVLEGKAYEKALKSIEGANSISIKDNTLQIYTSSEDIRGISSIEYIFRYQNNRFELIGLEVKNYGTSGNYIEKSYYYVNFSTKKVDKSISKEKIDSGKKIKEEKSTKNIDVKDKYTLDTMTEETTAKILEYLYKVYNS